MRQNRFSWKVELMIPTGSAECSQAWSRRGLLSLGAVTGVSAVTGGVAGCSGGGSSEGQQNEIKKKIDNPSDNFNAKGFPIVEKPVTIKFMTGKRVETAKDYNKVASWKHYEKKTNIRIDWGLVPDESLEEKRNLALNSGDYPEALYGQWLSNLDIGKYANQGVFVKLNELIKKYMPNLKSLMDHYPTVRKGMTFPDGGMYALPTFHDPDFLGMRIEFMLWVRGDWLDKLDMDVPMDTEQYYRYLKTVKTKKPGGKQTTGYVDRIEGDRLRLALMGSFGVGNRGSSAGNLDADPNDKHKVRFYPIADGYKSLLEYLHRLYRDGLIAKNVFSIDQAKLRSGMAKGIYGSIADIAPGRMFGGKAENFVPVPALKGPHGEKTYNNVGASLTSIGQFVITDKVQHPAEIARWMDYFYSDAGTRLFHMGVENVSFKKSKDGVEYTKEITDNPKGLTQTEAKKPYVTDAGGGFPGIVKEEYFKSAESAPDQTKAAKLVEPDAQTNVWPSFTYTQDEAERLDSLSADIDKYVSESREKFISSDLKLSRWNSYVDKIKKMGLDDYLEIQQAALDRYRKA